MVQQVIISEDAMIDLEGIQAFISHDSEFQAEKFVLILFNEAQKISKAPEAGTVVGEIGLPWVRQRLYKKYRIIYKLSSKRIEVLTFHHSSRLLKNNPHLKDYLK